MTTENPPPGYEEHMRELYDLVVAASGELWPLLAAIIGGANDVADANYVTTSICARLFAYHNAIGFVELGESREHCESKMLENFKLCYDHEFKTMVEILQKEKKANEP